MRSPGLRVPRQEGERIRSRLRELHALRSDLRIADEGTWILLPVEPGVSLPPDLGELREWEFEPATVRGPQDYRDLLAEWPLSEREDLPRSFDIVGDVVLIRVPPSLAHRSSEIGVALLQFVPGARIVGADHGYTGPSDGDRSSGSPAPAPGGHAIGRMASSSTSTSSGPTSPLGWPASTPGSPRRSGLETASTTSAAVSGPLRSRSRARGVRHGLSRST